MSAPRAVSATFRRAAALGLAAGVGCIGSPKILPPRTPPAAVAPPVALPATAPAPGNERVVIHTVDGPMRVVAEAARRFDAPAGERPRSGELCVSPCVVDVPPGRYRLYLSSVNDAGASGDVDDLQVKPGLTYYLRAPGRFQHPTWKPWGAIMVAIAGGLIATGGIAWTAAAASADSSALPGLVVLGAGVGLLIGGGIYTYDAQRGSLQEGATTQWTLPPR